MTYFTKENNN